MRYVVAYDISDDRVRERMSTLLERFGPRVQKSVFHCFVDDRELGLLTRQVKRVLGSAENGQVRFYRLCADCLRVSFGLGEVETERPGRAIIVA